MLPEKLLKKKSSFDSLPIYLSIALKYMHMHQPLASWLALV